jgi:hypothetical protein
MTNFESDALAGAPGFVRVRQLRQLEYVRGVAASAHDKKLQITKQAVNRIPRQRRFENRRAAAR